MQIDTSTEFGQRVERRLQDETIIWLTTVSPSGQPFPIPVWFLWDGDTALIYSQPDTPKLRNIERNSKVSLHFDSNGTGGNIIRFDGDAWIDADAPPASEVEPFIAKYGERIVGMGSTPEQFAGGYSVPVRVRPVKLRGH